MRKYLTKVTVAALLLAVAGGVLFQYVLYGYYSVIYPLLLLFFYLFSITTYSVQVSRLKSRFSEFARVHMIVTLLRLFVFSAVIIVFLILSSDNVAVFISTVVLLYIVFTSLETSELTRLSGKMAKKKTED